MKADKWTPASNNSSIASIFFAAISVASAVLIANASIAIVAVTYGGGGGGSWSNPKFSFNDISQTIFNHHKHIVFF